MYYELYIDVVFAVNMVMDFYLLLLTGKLLRCQTSLWRILLGSAAGSLGFCAMILIRLPGGIFRSVILYSGISSLMAVIGLRTRNRAEFIRGVICLYLGGFLLGGAYQWLSLGVRNFLLLSTGSYIILRFGMQVFSYMQIRSQRFYQAELYLMGRQLRVKCLKDTGNSLSDPVSGKPVSVLEFDAVKRILNAEETVYLEHYFKFQHEDAAHTDTRMRVHYIPYHSVGKAAGMMPGVVFEKMYIEGGSRVLVEKPVIAICYAPLASKENYQMILHPDLVGDQSLIK